MKANELMIGDWVNLRVEEDNFSDNISVTSTDLGNHYILKHIEPIPLTEEILEKNGFVFESKYYGGFIQKTWAIHLSIANFIVLYERENCFITSVLNLNTSIHYVHELQHALKLCGIEKEITL